jgi:hypothetical protein
MSIFGADHAQAGPLPGHTDEPWGWSDGLIQKSAWKGMRGAAGGASQGPRLPGRECELAAGANPAHRFGQGRLDRLGGVPHQGFDLGGVGGLDQVMIEAGLPGPPAVGPAALAW